MEVAALTVAAFALLGCGIAGGVAYGYRGQCEGLRDQVSYLRNCLALARKEPAPTPDGPKQVTFGGPR